MADKLIGETFKQNRLKAIGMAIRNHKESVITILALLDGVPVEEYKFNALTLPLKILQLLNDPELLQLFTSQGQTGDANSSGSV